MNLNLDAHDVIKIQDARNAFIKEIANSENKTDYVKENAESLFSLGLTMYSSTYSFESALYNGLSLSELDERVSLHPEQIKILKTFETHKGTILSAPTSFGKTFTVFEYIARYKPKCIVMVVPTLALIDEYKRKIINEYSKVFSLYRVYLSIDKEHDYNWDESNIFIVTHDRVVDEEIQSIISHIDFLVIDEVYKLQRDDKDDRVLILNLAYLNLVSIADKYVLLAPFICGVENLEKLEDKPFFYSTSYSPVVNEVIVKRIVDDSDTERRKVAKKILSELKGNTLVYFPTVKSLNEYILDDKDESIVVNENGLLNDFVEWAKKEIHEEWTVVKALEKGLLVHHGQLPLGIRMLELDLFNRDDSYNTILCTATLLEGINTDAENIIITKPSRSYNNDFDAFDFFNLVGRTGRLFKHYLGKAYYIQGPNDRRYVKEEALKTIEFEITTDSIDIDINTGKGTSHTEFNDFLNDLGIDYETYKTQIASKCRFATVSNLYKKYKENKYSLFDEINNELDNPEVSKLGLIRELYLIIEGNKNYGFKMKTFIINKLTYKNRKSVKDVVNETKKSFAGADIQDIIKYALELKNSYIEYTFYKKIHILLFFLEAEKEDHKYADFIRNRLLKTIENLYYINMPAHKMLKEMGVYEKDIKTIIDSVGDGFNSVEELRWRIINTQIDGNISVLSRYVLNRLIR